MIPIACLAEDLVKQVRRAIDHEVLFDILGRRVHAAQDFQHSQAIECAVRVPNRIQDLRGAVARSGIAFFGCHSRSELAFSGAHMPGGDQLIPGPDAQVQVARRLLLESKTDFFGDLLWGHGLTFSKIATVPAGRQAAERECVIRMNPVSATGEFAAFLLQAKPEDAAIRQRLDGIHRHMLAHSSYIRKPAFESIHPNDIEMLFRAYDEQFFDGQCVRALQCRKLRFRLSRRMTRAGGTTTRFRHNSGEVSYEIAIAVSMLFDGFGEQDRNVSVGGLICNDRLEALQRIFEHEMVHLAENLCWNESDCSASRFQDIAARFFLHRAHTHNLITRKERAADAGIRPGSRVVFQFEGRNLAGRVNRITKRVTVLVEDPNGRRYSDGRYYLAYYVPLANLRLVAETSA